MRKGIVIVLFILLLLPAMASAQGRSVCTKTASGLDDKSAKGMNKGILYLAAFPLTILGTIGFVWWRHNKQSR